MKTKHFFRILFLGLALFALCLPAKAQDDAEPTGFPGDNLALEGVLDLFKQSKSPEDFEKKLNEPDNPVNNLDLNEDGEVDYIRVLDQMDKDVHAIVLQVYVNEKEKQDVAVIEIEKNGPQSAILQIVGDEDVYGDQTLVEPVEETPDGGGKGGPSAPVATHGVVVNVWFWPCVRFVYAPGYRVWVSPFYWGFYPPWWRPWRPRPWHIYHQHIIIYRPHYHVVHTHRVVRAHRVYTPRRQTSHIVHARTTTIRTTRKANGARRTTTTRVTSKTPNGNVRASGQTTTTRGVVKTKDGVAVGKKTTTTRQKRTPQQTTTKKRTTVTGARKSKGGAVNGKKQTTTVKRRRKH
ncbi:MAG: hypothetical protein D6714_09550 [Bacteroidetes bacterium]|nr:MAG: hypothetical protein D6714_09550 [Bacteroidota bacterium]